MIAKFSTADDLMAHYATVRARLHGPAKRVTIHPAALPPPPPEPEPEPVPPPIPDVPMVMMPTVPVKPEEIRINFEEVVALVCAHLGYDRREIFAQRRTFKLCFDRQCLWALAHKWCLHMSLPQIGRASGGRDHTTVLHGRKKGVSHPRYAEMDEAIERLLEKKQEINAGLIEQANAVMEGV